MVSKIIYTLIALSSLTLFAHDNSNTISANAGSSGLESSHLKINHQSYFYIPSGDTIILDLTHSLHSRHMQNDMGLAYRTNLGKVTIGTNFYYMHTNHPRTFIHQFSPGVELFYKKWQISYNLYLPASIQKTVRRGLLCHSPISEFGIKWMIRKDLSVGLLPFYDIYNGKFGINSSFNYCFKQRFNFGVYPYYKPQNSGFMLSFGISFGTTKDSKSVHRSNAFNYIVKDFPSKGMPALAEVPKTNVPIPTPVVEYPISMPAEIEKQKMEEKIGQIPDSSEKEEESAPAPEKKEPESNPWNWRDYFPSYAYDYHMGNYYGGQSQEPSQNQGPAPAISAASLESSFAPLRRESTDSLNVFVLVDRDPSSLTADDLLATPESTPPSSPRPPEGSPPRFYDDYMPHRQSFANRHQSTPAQRSAPMVVREDYQGN